MLVFTYETTRCPNLWHSTLNTMKASNSSYNLLPRNYRMHLSVHDMNQDNSIHWRDTSYVTGSIPGRCRSSSFWFNVQTKCRMPCSLRLNVLTAASLKIGLVGKFLLTHQLQCQAIWETKKMFLGRRLHPGVNIRTFTPACSCLPVNILLNSVSAKAVRLKSEKSLHVLPTQERSSWCAKLSWKIHYNPSEHW